MYLTFLMLDISLNLYLNKKTKISQLVRTTRFLNNIPLVRSQYRNTVKPVLRCQPW